MLYVFVVTKFAGPYPGRKLASHVTRAPLLIRKDSYLLDANFMTVAFAPRIAFGYAEGFLKCG